MTYGYKKTDDGNLIPYPIDTQLPVNINKLTNTDIDILKMLIEQNLKKSEDHFKPEILQQISKKLDKMYFL